MEKGLDRPITAAGLMSGTSLDGIDAAPVQQVEEAGWEGDALEAQAFAYLAVRSLAGLPLSFPANTGTGAPTPAAGLKKDMVKRFLINDFQVISV